jgi:twitching motility protein PilT
MARTAQIKSKTRFGELLLEYGIITQDQLQKALRRQIQVGGHLGSILEEMGFLDEDSLLSFLSKQLNTPSMSLLNARIEAKVLSLVPFEKVKDLKVIPVKDDGGTLTLGMINPNDFSAVQEVEFSVGRRIEPVVVPCNQVERAIALFEKQGYGNESFDGGLLKAKIPSVEGVQVPDARSLFKKVVEEKATDLHITAGVPPSLRIDNELIRLSMPAMTPEQVKDFAFNVLTEDQIKIFKRDKEIDLAVTIPDAGRFRVNIYKQRNALSFAARLIIDEIPSINELNLPGWIADYALRSQGFILITGPSGHGKTTTMASLVDIINAGRKANIITLEDPIEYLHKHKKSNINQREIGVDTESFAVGLKHIFRQNPDVIVIGEMRDPESIAIALTAAETGHLVISTMHSLNAATAIDRIIDIFPANQQHQVRMQFADAFLFVLSQRLVARKDGHGRILAHEKMINSFRMRNLIRDEKTHGIRSLMQVKSDDVSSIDISLAQLCRDGMITLEDGLKYADNPRYYQEQATSKKPIGE